MSQITGAHADSTRNSSSTVAEPNTGGQAGHHTRRPRPDRRIRIPILAAIATLLRLTRGRIDPRSRPARAKTRQILDT